MNTKIIYLDHNATTPLDPEVLEAMLSYYRDGFGNPSSIHRFGRDAKIGVEMARGKVAELLGAEPGEIIFTGSGTEADNLAIKGAAYNLKDKGNHIITSTIEHPAVLNTCKCLEGEGFRVTYVNVDPDGIVKLDKLEESISDKTIIISIMLANNEIGTIQPIDEIGKIAKSRGICFHTDAVQGYGKIPINVKQLNVDLLSLSAHKIYGPKGIGALYVRKGIKIEPQIIGGHQERNFRAGTENVAGIVALGKASELASGRMDEDAKRIKALCDRVYEGIMGKIPKVRLNGYQTKILNNTLNCSFLGVDGESLLINLDLMGIAVSTGSACSSGSLKSSHVLTALGMGDDIARGSIRFSLGRGNTEDDIDYLLEVLPPIVERLRNMSPFWKDD